MQNLDFKVAVPLVAFVLLAVGAFWYTSNGGFGAIPAEENLTGAVEYAGEDIFDLDVVWDEGQASGEVIVGEEEEQPVMDDETVYNGGEYEE